VIKAETDHHGHRHQEIPTWCAAMARRLPQQHADIQTAGRSAGIFREHISRRSAAGDAGHPENARGPGRNAARQRNNTVTMVNRSKDFSKAKAANVEC